MEGLQLNIWSVLIIIGALQGYVLAFGLQGKRKSSANRFLSLFLLSISIHLTEYAIDISGLVLKIPHVFTASYPFLFMMGPFFLLYTLALFDSNFRFQTKHLLHFLPALIVALLFMPFYLLSAGEKIAFMQNLGASGLLEIPMSQFVFMVCHLLFTSAYIGMAWKKLQLKEEQLKQVSAGPAVTQLSWVRKISIGFVYYLGLYMLMLICLLLTKYYRVEIDYVMLLLTSTGVYLMGYTAIRQPQFFESMPISNGRQTRNVAENTRQKIKTDLEQYFREHKPHLNENLKLDQVAEALNVPAYQLSEVINESFGKNFFEFTNVHRVEEAKAILSNPQYAELKILAVAFDAGFGNKATFNRVFKKSTGLTPSQFRLSHTPLSVSDVNK